MYTSNTEAQYQPFLDEVGVALQKVTFAESIVLLGDFNAHVSIDDKIWKSVIERQGDSDINRNGSIKRVIIVVHFCTTPYFSN